MYVCLCDSHTASESEREKKKEVFFLVTVERPLTFRSGDTETVH